MTKRYIKEKNKVFRDFNIVLTKEQEDHIKSLKTEIAIDNYCVSIILHHLDRLEDAS